MSHAMSRSGLRLPGLTIFFSSACIMILEIVAGKLIARHVGMSLYTWTGIIGVLMLGISVGNYLGGKTADRFAALPTLALLFFLGACSAAVILPLNYLSGLVVPFLMLPWTARIVLHILFVFLAPALLLGMIHPVVVKWALDWGRETGRTVGSMFAWGVMGSLIGTFLTGFYLVTVLGVSAILFLSALGLAALSLLFGILSKKRGAASDDTRQEAVSSSLPVTPPRWFHFVPAAATVFLSNAAFMSFELAMMRVAAREFGGSLYTATTVIGVVLAGICLGNYSGGRIADRWRDRSNLTVVFTAAALAVALSPFMNRLLAEARTQSWLLSDLSWPTQIFIQMSVVCLVPCFFMGMVSPMVARRLLRHGDHPGNALGLLYAWGSVGAIAGTFLSGFFLIEVLGSIPLTLAVALALALTALPYGWKRISALPGLISTAAILCLFLYTLPNFFSYSFGLGYRSAEDPTVVYDKESLYSHITVVTDDEERSLREIRLDRLAHSRIDLRDPLLLLYEYEWIYEGVLDAHTRPGEPVRAFVIGGGGYAFPHYLMRARPGSAVTVAEIDPAVTEAAYAAFGLPREHELEIYDLDARNVVSDMIQRKEKDPSFQKFDYIFGDSINDYTVPFHLTTLEFTQALHRLLTDDGMYMFNMIDVFDSGAFLAAMVKTCRQVFPHVQVYNSGRLAHTRDTFVVVCSKGAAPLSDISPKLRDRYNYVGELLPDERLDERIAGTKAPLLEDDFAPVENLLAAVVRAGRSTRGERHLRFAQRYLAQHQIAKAERHVDAALEIYPAWYEAHEVKAQLLALKQDSRASIESLKAAIPGNPHPEHAWQALAFALNQEGRKAEALAAWQRCVELNPRNVTALYNVGVLYGEAQQLSRAVEAWKQALALQPNHEDSLYNLAVAELMMGEKEQARERVEKMKARGYQVDQQLLEALDE